MSNLKELKNRISSVKLTQKITRAMRMVAVSKLMRAKRKIDNSTPYINKMDKVILQLANSISPDQKISPLLDGTGNDKTHLIIVVTSDHGLCGAFNSSMVKECIKKEKELTAQNKTVKIFFLGKKGHDLLNKRYNDKIIGYESGISKKTFDFEQANKIAKKLIELLNQDQFDVCHVVYSHFKSAISQIITHKQLIPINKNIVEEDNKSKIVYEYEPNEEQIITELLPKNLSIQIYYIILENLASEHGARMTAMENATNNAQDMIKKLTLKYNRTRQATITNELIEIISGAEAL